MIKNLLKIKTKSLESREIYISRYLIVHENDYKEKFIKKKTFENYTLNSLILFNFIPKSFKLILYP